MFRPHCSRNSNLSRLAITCGGGYCELGFYRICFDASIRFRAVVHSFLHWMENTCLLGDLSLFRLFRSLENSAFSNHDALIVSVYRCLIACLKTFCRVSISDDSICWQGIILLYMFKRFPILNAFYYSSSSFILLCSAVCLIIVFLFLPFCILLASIFCLSFFRHPERRDSKNRLFVISCLPVLSTWVNVSHVFT